MNNKRTEILSLDSLKIGYISGKSKKMLLPPLKATANENELIAVIGRNGIGKSTLLRTITGLQPSLEGEVYINGKNLNEYSRLQLAQKVGYISTEIIKVSNMKVYDLVALGRFPHTDWFGKIDAGNHEAVMDSIRRAGMADFRERFVSELSDGERQRAMIAMVLAQDAIIMVMDEPTAFLDISSKYDIFHLLHDLTRKRKKTIIFSTHDLHAAISQADKIWLMLDGDLKEGAPEDMMLQGDFNHLFDKSDIKFNSNDGSLTLRREEKGRISVEGDGNEKYWTEKAIIRAGYSVTVGKPLAVVKVLSGVYCKWICQTGSSINEFGSIYTLISWLIKNETRII